MTSATDSSRTAPDLRRLSLKPDAPMTGFVDGAWWPASRELAAELPAVVAELAKRLGRVESVSYNLDAWEAGPYRIVLDGEVVRMAGYRAQDHDTVDVLGAKRRLTLLVVPPETDPQTAQAALTAAARTGNIDSVETLLHMRADAAPVGTG